MSLICATRALKNARYIQRNFPHLLPAEEPAAGFTSLIPFRILSRLHLASDEEMQAYPHLIEAARNLRAAVAIKPSFNSLFDGTMHFVQVNFDVGGTQSMISVADMQTMLQFAQLAAVQISAYAAQYGGNSLTVSPTILRFVVELKTSTFNDGDVQRWTNELLTANGLDAGSTCLMFPHPRGTTNTDADETKGIEGYHGKANCPYCYVNVFGTGFTVADKPDTQAPDHYALQMSHEMAEMTVDPNADDSNPEVCDPCGPNCGRVWRDYFYGPPINSYMMTSQTWPPTVSYGFILNAIVQPAHASDCPAPQFGCDYSPAISGFGQLLFYEASDGVGENWTTNTPTGFALQRHYEGWRTSWTKIIPGMFSGGASTPSPQDILFYDPSSGTGEFYQADSRGGLNLLGTNTGWRSDWAMIIPGHFSDSPYTDLLFYEPATGTGEFWRTDGQGGISRIGGATDWRTDWSMILPGNFGGGSGFTDLLFYAPSSGTGDFWRTDGSGSVSRIGGATDWRTDWTMIRPGNFGGGSGFTDLLFYQAASSIGDFWRTDGKGNVSRIGGSADWRTDWTEIIPGNFFGNPLSDLLFYQRESGIGSFWRTDGQGNVAELETFTDWRTSWTLIVKH